MPSKQIPNRIKDIVRQQQQTWTPQDRGLVFVAYIEDGEELAAQTGWPFYTGAKHVTDEIRLTMHNDWRQGITPIMICTSAFTTGNDYPHVRLTIHFKMALEMTELVQAQGRCGRDGEKARCFIIPASHPQLPKNPRETQDHKGLWYAHDHVYVHGSHRCLRYGSTLYLDSHGMECKEDVANMPCSVCTDRSKLKTSDTTHPSSICPLPMGAPIQSSTKVNPPSISIPMDGVEQAHGGTRSSAFSHAAEVTKKKRISRLATEVQEADRMRLALNKVKDYGCGVCLVMSQKPTHVGLWTCPRLQVCGGTAHMMEWKKKIRYPPGVKGICWICHVPTCSNMLHGEFVGAKVICEWEDVVIPTLGAIWTHFEIRTQAQEELGVKWLTWEAYTQWLVGMPAEGYYSRVMELFLWFVERVVGLHSCH
ncbi:hypothetical protein JVU11DRAFT_10939 [Chiua virens]|nr:hypothetical protein JVU11DRAFT_10939 [Chiua virens]